MDERLCAAPALVYDGVWTGHDDGKTMINALRGASLLAICAVLPLVGCAPLMRPEGPSKVAQRAPIDSGPSTQRRGPDGYPLLGAFPSSAAPQLADAEVNAERSGLQGAQAGQEIGRAHV